MINKSQLIDYKLRFLLPKRSRGHLEITAYTSIVVNASVDMSIVPRYLNQFNNISLDIATLYDMYHGLVLLLKTKKVELAIKFEISVDRVSLNYDTVVYSLPCTYIINLHDISINIKYPTYVKNVITTTGELTYTIRNLLEFPNVEDMVDLLQKLKYSKLYPITHPEDNELLQKELCKNPRNFNVLSYFDDLIKASKHKGWLSGELSMTIFDLYNINKVIYTEEW